MSVARCQREITYREFKCWQLKFQQEWDQPSRTDYYLMLIAHRILYVLGKTPKTAKLENQKLTFSSGRKRNKAKTQSIEELRKSATKKAKARWFGILGIKGKN